MFRAPSSDFHCIPGRPKLWCERLTCFYYVLSYAPRRLKRHGGQRTEINRVTHAVHRGRWPWCGRAWYGSQESRFNTGVRNAIAYRKRLPSIELPRLFRNERLQKATTAFSRQSQPDAKIRKLDPKQEKHKSSLLSPDTGLYHLAEIFRTICYSARHVK